MISFSEVMIIIFVKVETQENERRNTSTSEKSYIKLNRMTDLLSFIFKMWRKKSSFRLKTIRK